MLGKLDIHMQKNKVRPFLYTMYKINAKWMKDLKIRAKIIQFVVENKGVNLHYIIFGTISLIWHQKYGQQQQNIGNLDITKILNFSAWKDIIERVKRKSTEWKKILKNHLSDKGLIPRIYKVICQTKQNRK